MPDPTPTPAPEPTPAPTPTPPAPNPGRTFTQADIDAAAAAARRESESATKTLQKQLEQLQAQTMTEGEKKTAEAVKARETELTAKFSAEIRTLKIERLLAGKVRDDDVSMVTALIPADTPDDKLKTVIDEALKARPHLLATQGTPGIPPGGPSPAPGAGTIKRSQIRDWIANGEYGKHQAEVNAAMRAGKIVNDI
jgi:hypothetical protein